MAASREVRVAIVGDPSSLQRALRQSDAGLNTFQSRMQNVSSRMRSVGQSLTRSFTLPFIALGAVGVRELTEGENALAQTRAVIESTGGAAQKSVDDILEMSAALSEMSSVDDEDVQQLANTMLTFRNIAGPTFDQATVAALDLSAAMGTDLHSAAIQVGKAVNDPIRGLTALTRVGVTFSDAQREAITAMVAFGDTAGAQQIILEELNAEFGGSAEAAGETLSGRLRKAQHRFEELSAQIVADLIPALEALVGIIDRLATAFDGLTPKQQKAVVGFIAFAAVAGPLSSVVGLLASGVGALGGLFSALGAVMGVGALAAAGFAAAVALVVGGLLLLAFHTERGRAIAARLGELTLSTFVGAINQAVSLVRMLWGVVQSAGDALAALGRMTLGGLIGAINTAVSLARGLLSLVQSIATTLAGINFAGSDEVRSRTGQRIAPGDESAFIPSRGRSGSPPAAGGVSPIEESMERAMTRALGRTVSPVVVVNNG